MALSPVGSLSSSSSPVVVLAAWHRSEWQGREAAQRTLAIQVVTKQK
ncbi:hypothetical protein HT094_22490 [Shewanella sp. ZOR0012]|nr:hypothetical protein [Shewanella sp. ZOR0012]NSM26869.1 hypothetical protein [Shewanella sp. ZOR0012]